MTGSPMPHGPEDVWAQARMVNPALVPDYFTRWRHTVARKQGLFRWVPLSGWEDKCYSVMQPSIRYTRDECLDLPPCTYETREVDMTKEQKSAYDQMEKQLIVEMQEGSIVAVNEAVKMMKLVQIAGGIVYGAETSIPLDCKPKMKELYDVIQQTSCPNIVFVPFTHMLKMINSYLKSKGLKTEIVYGAVSAGKRSQIFRDFQDGKIDVLVAHPGTMAHGLTLTKSYAIIWWAPLESFEIYEQANGRITRPGQKHNQLIIHLQCSDIEKAVYKRLKRKEKMQGILLELLQRR